MTDIPEIAAKLTKAQRQALPLFEENVRYGPCFPPNTSWVKTHLYKLGLLERNPYGAVFEFRLTPLGVVVRDHIKGETTS